MLTKQVRVADGVDLTVDAWGPGAEHAQRPREAADKMVTMVSRR
jgi:hypothetical protein